VPDRNGGLVIGAQGDRLAADIAKTITSIRRAHDGLLILDEMLASVRWASGPRSGRGFGPPLGTEFLGRFDLDDPFCQRYIAPENELILRSVELASPGLLEFLGALNPLTFIRDMLNDRHARRQDRDYREQAERRSLELDNMLKENNLIRERLELAREFGLSPQQQVGLLNTLAIEPLLVLQDELAAGALGPLPALEANDVEESLFEVDTEGQVAVMLETVEPPDRLYDDRWARRRSSTPPVPRPHPRRLPSPPPTKRRRRDEPEPD